MRSSQLLKTLGVVAALLLLVAAIVTGVMRQSHLASHQQAEKTPSVSPTATPTVDPHNNEESLPSSYPTSAAARPSGSLILGFETAYNDPNPTRKAKELVEYVTPQYLAAAKTTDPDKSNGLTVVIDTAKSHITLSACDDHLSCVVTTRLYAISSRDGVKVAEYPLPKHQTTWVNTPSGWLAAQENGGDDG